MRVKLADRCLVKAVLVGKLETISSDLETCLMDTAGVTKWVEKVNMVNPDGQVMCEGRVAVILRGRTGARRKWERAGLNNGANTPLVVTLSTSHKLAHVIMTVSKKMQLMA